MTQSFTRGSVRRPANRIVIAVIGFLIGIGLHPLLAKEGFLLKTHWYQDGPFAEFTPGHDRVGCWSTACAQILYYHRLQPHGRVNYRCSSGVPVSVDFDAHQFDWNRFPDEITRSTPQNELDEVARYSYETAAVVQKDFGTGSYKRLLNPVRDLERHFDVDAKIYVHLGEHLPLGPKELADKLNQERITNLVDEAQIVSLLKTEINAGRPVYFHFSNIKDFGHSTVIDGFKEDGDKYLVHLNYGFTQAEKNRWYDLFAPIAQPDDLTLRAFVTIKPDTSKDLSTDDHETADRGRYFVDLLNERLPTLLKDAHVPAAAVAVIRDGQLIATVVAGQQEPDVPATSASLFNVASLTKPVVALAVLKLIDQGQLTLDEPLSPYWIDPDLRSNDLAGKLTPRIIMSHQTGFPNWRNGQKLQFKFAPGTGVGYSGEGFEYLRKAVEGKTHQTLEDFVSRLVFAPCGMTNTYFVWKDSLRNRYAREHDKNGQPISVPHHFTAGAADDLLTTIGDYGRFAAAMSRGGGLSSALFAEVCRKQVPPEVASRATEPADYGLCWRVVTTEHGTALMHGGSDQGVRDGVVVIPKDRLAAVVLTNGDNGGRIIEAVIPLVIPHGDEYLARYIGGHGG